MYHKAKKSLGQNFLKSQEAIRLIISAGEISEFDTVLEIGPGKGILTEKILEKAGQVIAIEKDRDLIVLLSEKFKTEIENKKLILLEDDVLLFDHKTNKKLIKGEYKVIANIPYYITGAIIKKFLASQKQPKLMVLLLQKEVVDRIVARDHKESILSMSVKVYGEPKYIQKVAKKYFSPAPKVDSAILLINNISKKAFENSGISEDAFFEIVKAGFAHKRKVLKSNISEIKTKDFNLCNLNEKIRAENLKLEDWFCLLSK